MHAQNNLGRAYEYGRGVEVDKSCALEWYSKAAAGGSGKGRKNLERLAPSPKRRFLKFSWGIIPLLVCIPLMLLF